MRLQLSASNGLNQVTGCGAGFVSVNGVRYQRSLLVTPQRLVPDWPASESQPLSFERIAEIVPHAPEVILLGTGSALRFPPAAALRPLIEAGIGYEVMDTRAACRTYNVLVTENRRVLAALIIG